MSVSQRRGIIIAAGAALLVGGYALARCPKQETPVTTDAARPTDDASPSGGEPVREARTGLVPPLAATVSGTGDVVVAALDGTGLRVQRIDGSDRIVATKLVLADVAPSPDAELKAFASADGIYVLWRGLHEGKLGRVLVGLDPDLKVRGTTPLSSSTACATRTDLWTSDGAKATAPPFAAKGAPRTVPLPTDADVTLLCDPVAAYAMLDADEHTDVMTLDDAHTKTGAMREKDFGEDEQRELSPYTIDCAAGFVRLASSGALAMREIVGGKAGPIHRLKTTIDRDADVVAVDASPASVVIVYTDEADDAGTSACTRVAALRIDRKTHEESTIELSPGRCGFEVGPFFTSAVGDAVSVAWPERTGGEGRPRAPIVSLATTLVAPAGKPALARIDQAAESLVDGACDPNGCHAVALNEGVAKVLRYNRKP